MMMTLKTRGGLIIFLMFLIIACGSQEKPSSGGGGQASAATGKGSPQESRLGRRRDRPSESGGENKSTGSGSSRQGDNTGGKPNPGPQFFASTVKPIFQTMCVQCHADPRQPVEVRAPLSVYSYEAMKLLLEKGGGPQDNLLWNTVRNLESHTGGDRCSSGANASPCKELAEWWATEFGASKGEGAGSLGRISEVTALGRVYGWAFDSKNPTDNLTVQLYIDGPKGTGTMVGSVVANRPGNDGNAEGDHAFTFDLPDAYRNGKQRDLYAYALIQNEEKILSSLPTKYTAYAFSQAGRDFYAANIQGRLNGCSGCHTISYEQQFYSLITPSPVKGGTATNNQLLNKAAQANGVSHGGGQSCGNANAAPCSEFQRWWQIEFGSTP